jgi:hypothetical protein
MLCRSNERDARTDNQHRLFPLERRPAPGPAAHAWASVGPSRRTTRPGASATCTALVPSRTRRGPATSPASTTSCNAPELQDRSTRHLPRARSPDRPRRPGTRQRGQQQNVIVARLHQHFDDRAGAAEIAVDLKGRMRVEHVGVRPPRGEQEAQDTMRMLAVAQPCPQVSPPCRRPAGRLVAAHLQRSSRRRRQGRRSVGVDLAAREQSVQV